MKVEYEISEKSTKSVWQNYCIEHGQHLDITAYMTLTYYCDLNHLLSNDNHCSKHPHKGAISTFYFVSNVDFHFLDGARQIIFYAQMSNSI
jgi:hypothetical protein